MRRLFPFIFAILAGATLLGGCESTTAGGATGLSRSQFLLVSSAAVNEGAAKAYTREMVKAHSAKALNTDVAQTSRVNSITQRLIAQVGVFRPDAVDWDWEINVIEDKSINAYCMPGGKMVIYTGIIEQLKLTDDELAAIIGHEMAHALREHSREQISRQVATNHLITIGSIFLGLGSVSQNVAGIASELVLALPFSRSMEFEADTMGVELMARAGFDPNAAVSVWKKMNALNEGRSTATTFLSTHPSDAARVTNLQNQLPAVMPLYEEAGQKGFPEQAAAAPLQTAVPEVQTDRRAARPQGARARVRAAGR